MKQIFRIILFFTTQDANPDDQDAYGNTVLHMVVVTVQLVNIFNVYAPWGNKTMPRGATQVFCKGGGEIRN